MSPTSHLALLNLLIGDIQGGLGPFLGTWLAETAQWSPTRIGLVTSLSGIGVLLLSGPFGALVDRLGRPRLLIAISCAAILAGTLLLLPARGFWLVLAAQSLAAAGGTLLLLAVTSLTLGMVGKQAFPRQQGRNQAFNHIGILAAAGLIALGTPYWGAAVSLWVLGAMAAAAIVATVTMPRHSWECRRSFGWEDHEGDDAPHRSATRQVLRNGRLLVLAVALALFQLGNGGMLSLLGQKLVAVSSSGTGWTATYVMVAQLTMVPVAYFAGSLADRRGRRWLLVVACLALPLRAALCAFIDDAHWLIAAEILDGIASGIIGVAVPVVVADLTWKSGRTQTALGTVNAIQGAGGAVSAWYGGLAQAWLGWPGAFLALGVAGVAATVMVFWLHATAEENPRRKRRTRVSATVEPQQA
ncbi:MFS transporter [Methylobacterium gnaphalii]|uniref:Putative MFS-type transporter n=1 Tax=Methylobacterium gnaphalii TaxID=1010610 RepID=A0A512JL99_9HYPH|nr:MFS transporter [Methylobacterium gnaphalii]GEP10714.1 putative MFS-type transporter [Methylobacterium gnaphalii]GJD67414.1 putative MFS-type transporter [Methylobacterium gnaphalii]GLS47306.1 MFS transporter [Methylobacterium gnaphalii]